MHLGILQHCVKSTYFWYWGHIWNNWNCWLCAQRESLGQSWVGGAQGCGDWWGTCNIVLCEINLLLIFFIFDFWYLCTERKLGGRGPRVRWSLVGNLGQPAVAWNSSVGKGTEKWGGTTVHFLPWFKAAFFLYLVVHGGYVEGRTGYTCSRTPSVQTILRSSRMSGWGISRRTARILKWWVMFLALFINIYPP